MIDPETRDAIKAMHGRKVPISKIRKLLGISKNTVRKVIRGKCSERSVRESGYSEHLQVIEKIFARCSGNVIRVQELLEEEHGIVIPYSSLTRFIREEELRGPAKKTAGIYTFGPGEEMQHDTSPYRILLNGKKTGVQCAALALAYSRRLYMQFYPCFTRFEARVFLTEAMEFMGGCCKRCTIDNTSVLIVLGTGPGAEVAPEIGQMEKFFGTRFVAHAVGHADRKARIERPFGYIENNFLAGRTFEGWNDLNEQARNWCINVSNKKYKKSIGMSPEAAYVMEKPHLAPLPVYIPPVYVTEYRLIDTQGYIHLDTNRYSVPYQLIGKKAEVHKHVGKVKIYHKYKQVAEHERAVGKRDVRITDPAHRAPRHMHKTRKSASNEETCLKGDSNLLDQYVAGLKKNSRGRGVVKMRKLLELKRTYPREAFMAAVGKASKYNLYDLHRLEKIIIDEVAGNFFDL